MKFYTYNLALLLSLSASLAATPVKLVSDIVTQFDGASIGIDGEAIARMKKYQGRITDLLLGKKNSTTGSRNGKYIFDGHQYTVQELRKKEEELTTKTPEQNAQLSVCLRQIREDFETTSKEFQAIAMGTKPIMAILIDESCTKRGRADSLLNIWAKTKEENEYQLFDQHIKSIKDFEIFATDLYNFLEDLTYSCPKACKQFSDMLEHYKHERTEKIKKVKQILSNSNAAVNEAAFLRFISVYLDKTALNEITAPKIKYLLTDFSKHQV